MLSKRARASTHKSSYRHNVCMFAQSMLGHSIGQSLRNRSVSVDKGANGIIYDKFGIHVLKTHSLNRFQTWLAAALWFYSTYFLYFDRLA